jgi:hypothetical protein
MAFPSVAARNTSSTGTASTSHSASLPASISSGDLLIVAVGCTVLSGTTPATFSTPSGWDVLDTGGATRVSSVAWYRVADGGEGASVAFTTSINAQTSHVSLRIIDHDAATPPEAGMATNPATQGDSPSLTPAGGALDYLWLYLLGAGRGNDGTMSVDTFPTDYTDGQQIATARSLAASAEQALNASAEDPGAPALTDVQGNFPYTVAVYPAASTDDIDATGALSFGSSADLSATGTLAATGAQAFGASAALTATGALAAVGAQAFGSSADLDAIGSLAAVGAIAFGSSANLDATGTLTATGAVVFGSSADLGSGLSNELVATGAMQFGSSADLDAIGELTATGAVQFGSTADLDATGSLAATGAMTWVSSADLQAATAGDMTATGSMVFGSSALLNALGGLAAVGNITFGSSAALASNLAVEAASGGWGFLGSYESELQRRRARARERKRLEEETDEIQDDLDRNIAQLLREQEAIDDRRQELDRLKDLARESQDIAAAKRYSERVATAFERAIARGNFSALEALDREMQRANEEEEFLILSMTLLLND